MRIEKVIGLPVEDLAWNPTGNILAFNITTQSSSGIALLKLGPQPSDNVYQLIISGDVMLPKWSPDGSKIAYFGFEKGEHGLWVSTGIGMNPVLMSSQEMIHEISWSPDGSKIAMVVQNASLALELVVVESTAPYKEVMAPRTGAYHHVCWSPDGKILSASNMYIDFIGLDNGLNTTTQGLFHAWSPVNGNSAIYKSFGIDVKSPKHGQSTIIADFVDNLKWSPDGSILTFTGDSPEGTGLFLVHAGSDQAQMVYQRNRRAIQYPCVSADNSMLAFSLNTGLYVIHLNE